jgi:RHS repeat-associated protein
MIAEYVYIGDQLLAMITKPSETEIVSYFHNDHLGTPLILTNDNQIIVWKAAYTPFGGADISVQTVENPFRLPGQYYDSETGLHYNYFRYYDPTTGRYVTPDPIGLEEGINLFVYVQNNPVNWLDPLGFAACPCSGRGNAPSPRTYQMLGGIAGIAPALVPLFGLEYSVLQTAQFYRGGLLDAQAYGGSPAYANYAFGVYMSAMGVPLSLALEAANAYGAAFSKYPASVPMSPNYPNIPASNVANITQGFMEERNGTLCQ